MLTKVFTWVIILIFDYLRPSKKFLYKGKNKKIRTLVI
jgi:hypothetical protein